MHNCKEISKCLKAGEVSEEVKDGPLISPPSLRIVSDHK